VIVNLLSNIDEDSKVEKLYNFNHVVAWSLRDAFTKHGVTCHLVKDRNLNGGVLPRADHSIIISVIGMKLIRDNEKCRKALRDSTRGKTALYLDSDYAHWCDLFDYVFTVVKPKREQPQYVYGGWGADPTLFYPEQAEKAIFLDSLMYNKYRGIYDNVYDIYKELLDIPQQVLSSGDRYTGTAPKVNATIHMPLPTYNKRHFLIYWPQMQRMIRKCHYYCCTQLGESGLTRIEAATCGALLVVPEALYRPRTMDSLECRIWSTRDELLDVLLTDVDVKANRKKALEHSWDRVAGRMLKTFEGKSD